MFFDGSLMKTGAGAGLLFISPLGKHLRYVLRLHFPASNNVAEYEALVNGLCIAIELGVRRLDARGDSQLVIDQVMKNSHCRDPKMEAYYDVVRIRKTGGKETQLNIMTTKCSGLGGRKIHIRIQNRLLRQNQASPGEGAAPPASFPPSARSAPASDDGASGRISASKVVASTALEPAAVASSLYTSARAASSSSGRQYPSLTRSRSTS
jgi:hypothetical protein